MKPPLNGQAHKPSHALLTMGDYGGTLAAVRLLGRRGVRVIMAEFRDWVPSRFSRFVHERASCPPLSDWEAYLAWLVDYARTQANCFLYPTSDDTAWLYAQHAHLLQPHFALWQPDVSVIYTLLNKKRLSEVCARLAIATPRTFFPESESDCRRFAEQLEAPFLLKPRTQIGLRVGHKGKVVNGQDDPWSVYHAFKQQLIYQNQLTAADPQVSWPMMQEYFADAMQSIVSVAGFIDASGRMLVRSSRKVLQRPRRLGVGLCFESIPVDPKLVSSLQSLCRELGYFGVFEAEFIEDAVSGQRLLIDFNPRYYGQMGFEIARGLPLPYLALLAATNQSEELQREIDAATANNPLQTCIYSTRWLLRLSLWSGWIARKHSWAELRQWRRWRRDPAHLYTDAVFDREDTLPYLIDIVLHVGRYLRHPRDFFRKFFLDT